MTLLNADLLEVLAHEIQMGDMLANGTVVHTVRLTDVDVDGYNTTHIYDLCIAGDNYELFCRDDKRLTIQRPTRETVPEKSVLEVIENVITELDDHAQTFGHNWIACRANDLRSVLSRLD